MQTPLTQYTQRASHLVGIVLGAVILLLIAITAVGLLTWLARAVWHAALTA